MHAPTGRPTVSPPPLQTPDQRQKLQVLAYLAQRPLRMAQDAAALAALTATYRDLYVVMDQMHKKDILGIARPLVEVPPAPQEPAAASEGDAAEASSEGASASAGPAAAAAPGEALQLNSTQSFYPIRDLTRLPDKLTLGPELEDKYMVGVHGRGMLLRHDPPLLTPGAHAAAQRPTRSSSYIAHATCLQHPQAAGACVHPRLRRQLSRRAMAATHQPLPPPPHTHTPQDKATAFPALLPNHVEMSYQLLMGVHLWPAMESYMPFFMDYDAAVRPGGSHGAAWLGLMPDQPDQSLRAA
jgi:hypothetical protein